MPVSEPIVAIATPPGQGAVGIVRVSGTQLKYIAADIIGPLPPPRVATLRSVRCGGQIIDHALITYFAAPKSFTGEQVIEVHTHGASVLTHEVMNAFVAAGARLARPGEFTERAFLNGKLDLIQAESVADLIESTSLRAARLALSSLSGKFSDEVNAISETLKNVSAQIEATIDFPEDDLPTDVIDGLVSQLIDARAELKKILTHADRGARLNNGIDIAIVGAPNVGKSTLLNVLARENKAIVTNVPGTTRDVLSVDIEIDGLTVRLHDTAGLRETTDTVEREGVRRAKEKISLADAILRVVDVDNTIADPQLNEARVPMFTVRNKIDLNDQPPQIEHRSDGAYIKMSAKFNNGVELLRTALLDHFELGEENDNIVLARQRHIHALNRAVDALSFEFAPLCIESPELAAERLRLACGALAELTGHYTNEDLLGDIFSTFCIGK